MVNNRGKLKYVHLSKNRGRLSVTHKTVRDLYKQVEELKTEKLYMEAKFLTKLKKLNIKLIHQKMASDLFAFFVFGMLIGYTLTIIWYLLFYV